jgi:ACS family pantothenate transporter-like MFS transporter
MAAVKGGLSATTEPTEMSSIDHDVELATSKNENFWIRLMTSVGWYPADMPSSEKLLVLKLDLSILVFGCLSFFTKYLDQQSLTNAYVRYVLTIIKF